MIYDRYEEITDMKKVRERNRETRNMDTQSPIRLLAVDTNLRLTPFEYLFNDEISTHY